MVRLWGGPSPPRAGRPLVQEELAATQRSVGPSRWVEDLAGGCGQASGDSQDPRSAAAARLAQGGLGWRCSRLGITEALGDVREGI